MLGHWLDGSGLITVLSGHADNALEGGHVTHARNFYHVNSASLHFLQQNAYKSFLESLPEDHNNIPNVDKWCAKNVF